MFIILYSQGEKPNREYHWTKNPGHGKTGSLQKPKETAFLFCFVFLAFDSCHVACLVTLTHSQWQQWAFKSSQFITATLTFLAPSLIKITVLTMAPVMQSRVIYIVEIQILDG